MSLSQYKLWIIILPFIYSCSTNSKFSKSIEISNYYPIANGNEWRYTAPENWKDGDYISKIESASNRFAKYFEAWEQLPDSIKIKLKKTNFSQNTYKHFDATKAAKMLHVSSKGVEYVGEIFSGGSSFVLFDKPILWFPNIFQLGESIVEKRDFTRFYPDGKIERGIFEITQSIRQFETVNVPAGTFKNTLKVEFDTYWNFSKGSEAKSINVYHHAKKIGVVKASARFIILKNGKELINRLVEPDLKTYHLRE